jgi:hypothetical protein
LGSKLAPFVTTSFSFYGIALCRYVEPYCMVGV